MNAYIVKFNHSDDDADQPEGMYLCLHAEAKLDAAEKCWTITGGESRGNFLISVTSDDKIECYWDTKTWKFFTIRVD
jgi:hypothetical protein